MRIDYGFISYPSSKDDLAGADDGTRRRARHVIQRPLAASADDVAQLTRTAKAMPRSVEMRWNETLVARAIRSHVYGAEHCRETYTGIEQRFENAKEALAALAALDLADTACVNKGLLDRLEKRANDNHNLRPTWATRQVHRLIPAWPRLNAGLR
jgi:hypothetical protein